MMVLIFMCDSISLKGYVSAVSRESGLNRQAQRLDRQSEYLGALAHVWEVFLSVAGWKTMLIPERGYGPLVTSLSLSGVTEALVFRDDLGAEQQQGGDDFHAEQCDHGRGQRAIDDAGS